MHSTAGLNAFKPSSPDTGGFVAAHTKFQTFGLLSDSEASPSEMPSYGHNFD